MFFHDIINSRKIDGSELCQEITDEISDSSMSDYLVSVVSGDTVTLEFRNGQKFEVSIKEVTP